VPRRNYAERRTAEGLCKREIIRCLERYIFNHLSRPATGEPALQVNQTAA